MRRVLTSHAPTLLGLVGGGVGLVIISVFIGSSPSGLMSCSCGLVWVLDIIKWPIIVGSVSGLSGCFAYLANKYLGGALLLIGGVVALAPLLYIGAYTIFFPLLFFFLAPSLFFASLLVLGALLSFPKTRRILRTLHDGGWIP